MKTTLAVLLLGFSAFGLAAEGTGSASAPAPRDQIFEVLDTNRDGQLSFSEAFAHPQLSNAFNLLDTNADGALSRAEASLVIRA